MCFGQQSLSADLLYSRKGHGDKCYEKKVFTALKRRKFVNRWTKICEHLTWKGVPGVIIEMSNVQNLNSTGDKDNNHETAEIGNGVVSLQPEFTQQTDDGVYVKCKISDLLLSRAHQDRSSLPWLDEHEDTGTNQDLNYTEYCEDSEGIDLLENLREALDENYTGFGHDREPGEDLYGVSTKWICQAYDGLKSIERRRIPVDNSDLLDSDEGALDTSVKLGRDVVFVTESDWQLLLNCFPPSKKVKTLALLNGNTTEMHDEANLRIYDTPTSGKSFSRDLEVISETDSGEAEACLKLTYLHSPVQGETYHPSDTGKGMGYSNNSDTEVSNGSSRITAKTSPKQNGSGGEGMDEPFFNTETNLRDGRSTEYSRSTDSSESDQQLKLSTTDYKLHKNHLPSGAVGIHNMGNTCYMNSALQCMSSTLPLTLYFLNNKWLKELNTKNTAGSGGVVARAYADLIRQLWNRSSDHPKSIIPRDFRLAFSQIGNIFMDYYQHDSQEFLGFLFDVLHEDLNRVSKKVYTGVSKVEDLPDDVLAKKYWDTYRENNNSIIMDLFQGLYRSTLECLKCGKRSITFDAYMFLSLPITENSIIPVTAYFVSLTNNSNYTSGIKFELNMSQNSTVRDLKCEVAKRLSVNYLEDAIERYTVLVCSSNTISLILKDSNNIPTVSLYKKLFVVETNLPQCEQINRNNLSHPPYVITPAYFVNSSGEKSPQIMWQPENLNFPILFTLPSVMRVPIPANKAAQLKKQKLSVINSKNDTLLHADVYRDSLNVIGYSLFSTVVSNLRAFMNNDYIETLLNIDKSPGSAKRDIDTSYVQFRSSLTSPDNIYKHSLTNSPDLNGSEQLEFTNIEGKIKTLNSYRKQKARTESSNECSFNSLIRENPAKNYVNDNHPLSYVEQKSNICDPLTKKLYSMVKVYISSPRDSYSYWASCDLSAPYSDFYSRRWSVPTFFNIINFSEEDNVSPIYPSKDCFTIETDTPEDYEYQTMKTTVASKSKFRDSALPLHVTSGTGLGSTAVSNSYPTKTNKVKHNHRSKVKAHAKLDNSDNDLSLIGENNRNSSTLHDLSASLTHSFNEDLIPSSGDSNINGNCTEYEEHSTENNSSDMSRTFEDYTRDQPNDNSYSFVYRIPQGSVLVVEWNNDLLRNLFRVNKSFKDSSSLFEYKEDPNNKGVLQEREEEANKKKNLDLLDCIKSFCEEEVLSEKDCWLCPSCKSYQPAKKKLDIWSVPEILVFNLKRFSSNPRGSKLSLGSKIDTLVNAKLEGLKLDNVIVGAPAENQDNSEGDLYDLFAVSNHYGTLYGGHYVAYTKNPIDNNWYCFDDSNVYPISHKEVVTPAAYFLLYQRRKGSPRSEFKKDFMSHDSTHVSTNMSMEHAYI